MNKFFHTTIKVTGFVLNKLAKGTVITLKYITIGTTKLAVWAMPRLVTLHKKLN